MTRPLVLGVVVAAAAILPYVPSLDGELVYDDTLLITHNEHVHSLERPWRFFTDPNTLSGEGYLHSYRPIRTTMFAVQWALFGPRAWAYRIVSVLLHAGVAVLLLIWMRRLGLPDAAALCGALLFAVHPVAVEAVAWISIQGDLVMAGGLIGALVLLERNHETPARLAAVAGLFLLALGGKEAAVILPALLVARRLWPMGVARGPSIRAIAIVGVVAGGYLLLRSALVAESAHRGWYGGSRWSTYGAVLYAVNTYAAALLFPVSLTIRWAPPAPPPTGPVEWALLFSGAALLIGLVRWSVVGRVRRPVATGGVVLLLLALVPAANLAFPLPTVRELRYLYLPLAFLALAVSPLLARAPRSATVVLLLLLATLAGRRALEWKTPEALWTAAVERPRSSPEALLTLATVRAGDAHAALQRGEVDPPSLHEAASLMDRYLRERGPLVMHPEERRRAIRQTRYLYDWLRRAGDIEKAHALRDALLAWCPILHRAGRHEEAAAIVDDVRRW